MVLFPSCIRRTPEISVRVVLAVFSIVLHGCGAPGTVGEGPDNPADNEQPYVDIIHEPEEGKVNVFIDGQHFTSYLYSHPLLKKSVLFPVLTASGHTVTRGYPLDPREGESTDHTHHHGVWFNHGDVNGVDYWNAGKTPPGSGVRYGRIDHDELIDIQSGATGSIRVAKNWIDDTGALVLREQSEYEFEGSANTRIVTQTITLTAMDEDVHFEDSKEALFAIRVAKELEIRTDEGQDSLITGHYLNSEGVAGYPDVWGRRASWMQLSARINNTPVSVLIFDQPENINHPPHWMARDYGLFAVNNLGSAVYTNGNEILNFVLGKNESITFRYQLVVIDNTAVSAAEIQTLYEAFVDGSD